MLNDHLEHSVWNAEVDRITLVVDMWHPDLTEVEKTPLTGIRGYTEFQSQAISTWRERDSRAQEHHTRMPKRVPDVPVHGVMLFRRPEKSTG